MKVFSLIFSLLLAFPLWAQEATYAEVLPAGKDAIYKADFRVTGTSMNGFLAVSHKRNHVLQVSFTSVMGTNMLEMVWKKGRWKKIYANKSMDRRGLIEMLQEDIILLFLHFRHAPKAVDQGNLWLWNGRHIHLDVKDGRLMRLRVKTKKHLPSREVNYSFDEQGLIKELSVSHTGYPFSLVLSPVHK
jgi:hypothetical protein